MKQLVIYSIIFFLILETQAQPGYFGKKLSIGYSFQYTPFSTIGYLVIIPTTTFRIASTRPKFIVIIGHHANISFVINRKMEVFADVCYRDMEYYHQNITVEYYSEEDQEILVDEWQSDVKTFGAHELYGDIGIRLYSNNSIAPIGAYQKLSVGLAYAGLDKSIKSFDGNSTTITAENVDPVSALRVSYGLGIKSKLAGRIYMNIEGNLHLLFGMGSNSQSTGLKPNGRISEEYYAEAIQNYNFSSFKRYDARVGIGIMF